MNISYSFKREISETQIVPGIQRELFRLLFRQHLLMRPSNPVGPISVLVTPAVGSR